MNLWMLERIDITKYDEYISKVIRASTERKAREIANILTGDEGMLWDNKEKVTCKKITYEGTEGVIFSDFHTG